MKKIVTVLVMMMGLAILPSLVFAVPDSPWTNNSNSIFIVPGYPQKVGIGTSSPGTTLDVNGSIRLSSGSQLQFGIPGAGNHQISATDIDKLTIRGQNADGWVYYFNTATNTLVTSGSYVGIGTTAPVQKLDVSGIIRTRETTRGACNFTITGSIAYEENNSIGRFYGCRLSGVSTYEWVALH